MVQTDTSQLCHIVEAGLLALNTLEVVVLAILTQRGKRGERERHVLLDHVAEERGEEWVDQRLKLHSSPRGNGRV